MCKRVLIICNNSGGLYSFRNELISNLIAGGNEVIAVTPRDDMIPELRKLGLKLIFLPIDRRGINPQKDISLFMRYISILRKYKPSQVITYTIKPNIYGGFACRLLHISYAANITGLGTAFEKRGALRKIVTIMYKFSLKRAKVVFFENCENQQLFIDEKIVPSKKTCLLNGAGINLDHYYYQDYPMDTSEVRFLFIGRVMKEKGINELFKAMRMLRKNGMNCTLDVLGSYEENYESIIHKFESEGWLHYHGYQKDVRPFIRNCHCFVLPSWHEGMANTNLECASSGRPIITSNIPGCKEAVVEGSGFLCEPKDANSLYEAMKKMIMEENREKMGRIGRKHMEDVFDKRKVVAETLKHLL